MTDKKNIPTHVVACPRCRKSARYDATNPSRPFCSPVCKDEDIIAWAQEDYKVPGKPALEEAERAQQDEDD